MGILKKIILVSALFGIVAISSGCQVLSDVAKKVSDGTTLSTNEFWAINFTTSHYYVVTAQLMYSGTKCEIYVDVDSVGSTTAQQISNAGLEFDTNIYTLDSNTFGPMPDVDHDGKATILIYNIPGGDQGGGSFMAGYFDPAQLLTGSYSTGRDLIYLNRVPAYANTVPGSVYFNKTVAHEFQHLINYNVRHFLHNWGEQDTWLNEGLSISAEQIYSRDAGGDDRVAYYNSGYGSIPSGENFVTWNNDFENYVTAYLFFQWLRIQAGGNNSSGGTQIFKDIAQSSVNDYSVVVSAVNSRISGLGTADWQTILVSWFIANKIHDTGSGLYGYKGYITTSPALYSSTSVSLNPGCGVYISTSSPTPSFSGTIAFAGISGTTPDTNGPVYTGSTLIAYNYNGTVGGASGSANNWSLAPVSSAMSLSLSKAALTAPRPIDICFKGDVSSTLKSLNKK